MDAEDAKSFQHADVLGPRHIIGQLRLAAALEAQVVALEAHATTKKLNDLRTLGGAHIHQPHGAHTPTVPPLSELLGADEKVYRRVRLVDLLEERA